MIAGTRVLSLSPLRGALLGLLATARDDGLSTARIMELLWNPGPHRRLRHRISQLIYSLNREFAQQLVVKKRHRHYLSEAVATDYQFFEKAIATNRLTDAAAFLRRGFLSDLSKPPSDAFSDWLDKTRFEQRARIGLAATRLWTRLDNQARWKEAVEPAQLLLSLNAYDELALRMLIRAEAMAGRVREAEAAFAIFVERSELDNRHWAPHADTLSLVDQIRDMPSRAGTKVAGRALHGPPLIGRAEELAALSTAMLPKPADRLRLVVIRGERGTGKSRLLEESLTTDRLSGVRVFCCRASRTGRRAFLNSVLDALASSDIGSQLRGLAQPWRATLLELLTEPHVGAKPPLELPAVETDRIHRRQLEAIGQLLVRLAGNEPIILFIDDFHRVEGEATALLRHAVRNWPSLPLAVTLAVATESVREKDPLNRLFGNSLLRCEATELSLGELTREAAAELVDTIADGRIDEQVRDRIVELSDRNPLFLLRLAALSLAGSRLPNLDPDDFVPVPQSISDVFSGRLAELDSDAERTLQLLSVLGRPVAIGGLSKLTDRSRDSCVEVLATLQQSRLVGRTRRGFAVRQELIRHAVYEEMAAARRKWAHNRVASHLDDASATATPAELSVHYRHAGMPAKALRHALIGAVAAEQSGDFAEAARLFALARQNIHGPRTHARMAERLARVHYMRREAVDGPGRLAVAASQLRKVQHLQSALVADIQRVELQASIGSFSLQEAVARIRELRRAAEQTRHWKAAARAIDLELHIHRREGHAPEADALAAHAGTLLGQVDPGSRGSLHASLAVHHQGNFAEGFGHAREAIVIARRKHAPDELLRALVRLVAIQGARGLIAGPEAVLAMEDGATLARDSVDFVEHYNLLASAGTGYRAIGRLDQAGHWFAKAGRVLAKVETWESHVSLECKLGELALEARDLDRSAAHFARAQRLWTPGMGRHLGVISHSGACLTALREGRIPVARAMADHIPEPPARWFEDPWVFALFTAHLSRVRHVTRDGVDAVGEIAEHIETSQPANWARLKFEEALLRLRHSLPQRYEIARTAAEAATDLGINRRLTVLKAAEEKARSRDIPG